jgi:phosphoribosylglycinamide formyltransferase-1
VNVGVLGSSGGSVFSAAQRIFAATPPVSIAWSVATDRPCGLARAAAQLGIPYAFVPGSSAASSAAAAEFFAANNVHVVLLYHTRIVERELFARLPTINFHPAVLPAFPGLHALERTVAAAASMFGATAHVVDASVDGGPIIAQVAAPLADAPFESIARASFVQKTYLTLLVVDALCRGTLLIEDGGIPRWLGEPQLAPALAEAFAEFAQREDDARIVPC